MKLRISESEKKSILGMYGLVNEQGTAAPAAPTTPTANTQVGNTSSGGVGDIGVREINGMDVKASFIEDGNDLSTFLTWSGPNYSDKFMAWYEKAKDIIPTMANQWRQDFLLKQKEYLEGRGQYPYYVKQIADAMSEGLSMAATGAYDPNMSDVKFRELFAKVAPSLEDAKWKLFDVFKLIYNEQKSKLG